MLVLGRGGKNQGAHFHHRAAQIKVPQVTALQEFRVHMLVTVMELYIIAGIETVGRPEVQAAAFAADGIANDLSIIRVAAQIMVIEILHSSVIDAGNVGVNALCAQIQSRKPWDAGDI